MKNKTTPNVDDKAKLADIKLKIAQTKDLPGRLKLDEDKMLNDRQKTDLDKISQIGSLLQAYTVSSPEGVDILKFTPVFDEEEVKRLKLKLFQLLRKI